MASVFLCFTPLFCGSWYSSLKIILKQLFASGSVNIRRIIVKLKKKRVKWGSLCRRTRLHERKLAELSLFTSLCFAIEQVFHSQSDSFNSKSQELNAEVNPAMEQHPIQGRITESSTCKYIIKITAAYVYAHGQLRLCFYVLLRYFVVLDIHLWKLY